MKKLISIILSLLFCLAFGVGAFLVEASPQVDDKLIADLMDDIGDLVNAESEGDNEAFNEAVESLFVDVKDAQQTIDTKAITQKVVEYALEEDSDVSSMFTDFTSVEAVINIVAANDEYDVQLIKKQLKGSAALNKLVNLYTGAYAEMQKTEVFADGDQNVNQPAVVNPATGDHSSGVAVALTTLVFSAMAVMILSKKEN